MKYIKYGPEQNSNNLGSMMVQSVKYKYLQNSLWTIVRFLVKDHYKKNAQGWRGGPVGGSPSKWLFFQRTKALSHGGSQPFLTSVSGDGFKDTRYACSAQTYN